MLWFAWKFVPLWYQQQRMYRIGSSPWVVICLKIRTFVVSATTVVLGILVSPCCDLLENSYLCGISNNSLLQVMMMEAVVICLKIRTFVVSATTSNWISVTKLVVICLKIRTFVVSATTLIPDFGLQTALWFAWKFVPLWYQQQLIATGNDDGSSCDLLENSYLCGISNNIQLNISNEAGCDLLENSYLCGISNNHFWKCNNSSLLWFAWKFVPLWYQQQPIKIN